MSDSTPIKPVDQAAVVNAAQKAVVSLLTSLAAHHVAGADILLATVTQAVDMATRYKEHYDQLVLLLQALQPFFEVARDWLVEGWEHLVELFDWAKDKWNEIFGSK